VPFLPLATAQKVGLPVGLVVAAGGEVLSRYRRFVEARTWCREG
jgi:hypothetical protein